MSGAIIPISLFAFLIIPAWMMSRGQIVAAGLAMIGIALSPWAVWILGGEDLSGPGTGIALLATALMSLLALIPIAVGISRSVYRRSK
jgi:hypothetical protein